MRGFNVEIFTANQQPYWASVSRNGEKELNLFWYAYYTCDYYYLNEVQK